MTTIEPNPAVTALTSNQNQETNPMPASTTATTTTTPSPTVSSTVGTSTTAPATTSTPVVLASSAPTVTLPPIPGDWTPLDLLQFRGRHPRASEVSVIPSVLAALTGSTTYAGALGTAAPSLETLLQLLSNAVGWSNICAALETYLLYAKAQDGLAWEAAQPQLTALKTAYEAKLVENPQLPVQFPTLARLFSVSTQIAKKSAATRVRNAKAKADAAAKTAGTVPTVNPNLPTTAVAPTTGGAGH